MKKALVCILSIIFLLVGALSVIASGKFDNKSPVGVQKSISTESFGPASEDSVDIQSLNSQKEIIFNNLLNCVDYYDVVKGSFETTLIDKDPVTVAYEVDIPKQISFEKVSGKNIDLEILCQDGAIFEANKIAKNYNVERFIPQYDEATRKKQIANIYEKVALQPYHDYEHKDISSERARTNTSGENEYFYRYDLTNTGYAANGIYPQNLVFGFMSDVEYWNITAIEEYLDRQVLVVVGETSDQDYAEKLQTISFEIRFDLKTGILLDFKGFSSNRTLQQYLTTTSFSADVPNVDFRERISDMITYIKSEYTMVE